ncbi:MAG: hypothetical protein GWO10_12985, partial [candidate division Zixibacteria bacterium]|nr:hypothetical protein [candidate division Zixibacteria bacterium]
PANTAVNAEGNAKDADFFFHKCEDRDKVAEALGDIIEKWHRDEKDYMCVVPQKKGPVGCEALNPVLQERLNPNSGPG